MPGGWHHWGGRFMGFGGGGMIMMIIWLVVIVGLIIFLVKQFSNNSSTRDYRNYKSNSQKDPLEIAKKRYANGEIDKEEFQEIKNELKN
ncbi:MAG: SHOCT domain-containing protein [Bacillota bacterium]